MARRTSPPFRADHVGSLLRPQRLLQAREDFAAGRISAADLRSVEDQAIPGAITMQQEVGLQSATDGEFRRASWHMDFIYALGGVSKAPGHLAVKFHNAAGDIEYTPASIRVDGNLHIDDTISRTGSLIFRDTSAGVVFCPEHAQLLADAGYTKADVQAWLMEHCGRTGADLRRAGKNGLRGIARFADADTSQDDTFTRILPSPRHVPIVVAGARNAAISMVVRVFGEWSGTAVEVSK